MMDFNKKRFIGLGHTPETSRFLAYATKSSIVDGQASDFTTNF
jgi:hypothetical protein